MQLRGGGSSTGANGLAVDAARDDLRLRWWWQWQQIDELAVDAALMDLRLRWWWQWQQTDELGSGCSSGGFWFGFGYVLVLVAAARQEEFPSGL